MSIVIGPVLRRGGGYGFDTWAAGEGLSRGYPYRRIEDAHYARNAEIRASVQRRARSALVCQTLDEFIAESTACEMLEKTSSTSLCTGQLTRASSAFLPTRNP